MLALNVHIAPIALVVVEMIIGNTITDVFCASISSFGVWVGIGSGISLVCAQNAQKEKTRQVSTTRITTFIYNDTARISNRT